MMRAITLWNPWAAAIALGWKNVETRGRGTKLRGEFAIQSAKRWGPDQREAARQLALQVSQPEDYFTTTDDCPANRRGVVVCVARLVRCEKMHQGMIEQQTGIERSFGGWEPGRYAWFFEDVELLEDPLPLRGQQGIWTLPKSVEDEIRERAGLSGTPA